MTPGHPGSGPASTPQVAVPRPPRPRWGYRATLFQVRQPAFWVFVALLILTGLVTLLEQRTFAAMAPIGWLMSWVLLALYAVPVGLLIYLLDLYEREPLSLVFGAFLWGAVIATTLASIANFGWGLVVLGAGGRGLANRWTPALTAPFVEETIKGAGVVMIYLIARREIDDTMDGFVYGAMIGLGFAVVEDIFYFIARFGGSPGAVLVGFFVRVIAAGLYSHILWSGLTGIGVAFFVSRREEAGLGHRFGVAAGLFLLAVAGHFLWNAPWLDFFPRQVASVGDLLQFVWASAVKGLPLLAVVVAMVWLARRREHRWLRAALATEVGGEGILQEELAALSAPATRRRARRTMGARAGSAAADLLKRLQREQINLAMIASRVPEHDHPDLVNQRRYCRALRESVVRTMAGPPAPPPATGVPPPPPPGAPAPPLPP
jgi:RsiW-degrading membrane proteinase PrsW (M82 family)